MKETTIAKQKILQEIISLRDSGEKRFQLIDDKGEYVSREFHGSEVEEWERKKAVYNEIIVHLLQDIPQ
jgi:hypothetical protein